MEVQPSIKCEPEEFPEIDLNEQPPSDRPVGMKIEESDDVFEDARFITQSAFVKDELDCQGAHIMEGTSDFKEVTIHEKVTAEIVPLVKKETPSSSRGGDGRVESSPKDVEECGGSAESDEKDVKEADEAPPAKRGVGRPKGSTTKKGNLPAKDRIRRGRIPLAKNSGKRNSTTLHLGGSEPKLHKLLKSGGKRANQAPSRRRTRCKKCEACQRGDCGECTFCFDMVKFGGPGRAKQTCMVRQCLQPMLPFTAACVACGLDGWGQQPAIPIQKTNREVPSSLMECSVCYEIIHPDCLVEECPDLEGLVNEDLPNSWECPKCCKDGKNVEYRPRHFRARDKSMDIRNVSVSSDTISMVDSNDAIFLKSEIMEVDIDVSNDGFTSLSGDEAPLNRPKLESDPIPTESQCELCGSAYSTLVRDVEGREKDLCDQRRTLEQQRNLLNMREKNLKSWESVLEGRDEVVSQRESSCVVLERALAVRERQVERSLAEREEKERRAIGEQKEQVERALAEREDQVNRILAERERVVQERERLVQRREDLSLARDQEWNKRGEGPRWQDVHQ